MLVLNVHERCLLPTSQFPVLHGRLRRIMWSCSQKPSILPLAEILGGKIKHHWRSNIPPTHTLHIWSEGHFLFISMSTIWIALHETAARWRWFCELFPFPSSSLWLAFPGKCQCWISSALWSTCGINHPVKTMLAVLCFVFSKACWALWL